MRIKNVKCCKCNTGIYRKPAEIKRSRTGEFYCSNSCHALSMKKGQDYPCLTCGKLVYRSPSELEKNKTGQIFCSKKCQAKEQNEFGIASYNYKGLEVKSYRIKAFRKYENKCNRCGYDKYLEILQVHHKDYNSLNNRVDNLEILCPNCHYEEHYIK